jgi:hypothetical protein
MIGRAGYTFAVPAIEHQSEKARTMGRTITLLAALGLVSTELQAQTPASIQQAVASITPQDIEHGIGVIADDSMRGRNTPSPELDETAQYIASQFQRFGLKPGGDDGTFLQRYGIGMMVVDAAASGVTVNGAKVWTPGEQVLLGGRGASSGSVSGTPYLITGGAGDSTVLASVLASIPKGSIVLIAGLGRNARPLLRTLMNRQPSARVMVSQVDPQAWSRMAAGVGTPRAQLLQESEGEGGGMTAQVQAAAAADLLRDHGFDPALVDADPNRPLTVVKLDGIDLGIQLGFKTVEQLSAPNVVGILEGSDPTLKNEYLVFSAHMDHVGVGRIVNGDSVYNGADDDASGTIGVVELAEAFSRLDPRPKRSIIFLTVSGEEKGLWGSEHFAANPPVPIAQIVADLNADMIGRNWKDTIVVIGKEHSDLGATLNRVNAEHPELDMTAIDDIWPEENFYSRSDHYNFARRGVPVLFFFNGTHPDYHKPSDELSKIDAEKESRIVKLLLYLGIDIANAPQRPKWNPESYEKIVS